MLITPDFSEASEFTPIKAGTYKARITGADVKTSKAGDTYVKWTWTIFGAEGDYAASNNRAVSGITMVTGKGSGSLRDLLKAVGIELQPGESFDPTHLFSKEALIIVQNQKDKDGRVTEYMEVRSVRPLTQ